MKTTISIAIASAMISVVAMSTAVTCWVKVDSRFEKINQHVRHIVSEIEDMGDDVYDVKRKTKIILPGQYIDHWTTPKTIAVDDAIEKILDHMGMEFKYVEPSGGSVVLVESNKDAE